MKPRVWLRIAAVIAVLNAAGHTAGLLSTPHDPEARAAIQAMRAHQFDAMGSLRSYWEFYSGFSLIITVTLLLVAVLSWQLGSLAETEPAHARPLIGSLCVAIIGFAILSWIYLFAVPTIIITAISACLAVAWFGAGKA